MQNFTIILLTEKERPEIKKEISKKLEKVSKKVLFFYKRN